MKKLNVLFVSILASLVFVSGAIANIPNSESMQSTQEGRCSFTSNVISTTYKYQKAGDNKKTICTKLKKQYGLTDKECEQMVSLSDRIRANVGEMSPEEMKSLFYENCVEATVNKPKQSIVKSEPPGTWAKKEDLVGAYEIVQLPEEITKINSVPDPFRDKYQWFVFEEDGTFKVVMSEKNLGLKSKKEILAVHDEMKVQSEDSNDFSLRYRFLQEGFIALHREATPDKGMAWSVNVITSRYDTGKGMILEIGDIVMGYDRGGERVFLKQLRKLPDQ